MDNNSFYSIDRLVEFGLGMSMAQQMVGMMNRTMQNMHLPGGLHQAPSQQQPFFYVAIDGKAVGPLTARELTQLIQEQKVNKDTLSWMPGMQGWKPVEQVPDILKIVALTPPPLNFTCNEG